MFKVNNKDARKTPIIVNFEKINVRWVIWKLKECINDNSLMYHGNGTSGSRNCEELKIDPSVLLYNVQTSFVQKTKNSKAQSYWIQRTFPSGAENKYFTYLGLSRNYSNDVVCHPVVYVRAFITKSFFFQLFQDDHMTDLFHEIRW